ncbi:CoA pyrophosphatase [Alysiella filiformis]|nr:CoA pyrophosphatase [Alysiella filiformis]
MIFNEDDLSDFLAYCVSVPIVSRLQQRSQTLCSPQHRAAAVLIGIAPHAKTGAWQILLTRRAETLRHHTGQIAFAGGKCDPNDPSPIATALRETFEETGISPNVWRVSGCLPVCCTPSGYAITPVLAHCDRLPETQANAQEVAEIFWLPLDVAVDASRYTSRANLPALPHLHYDIWGATALMLHYLAECWSAKSDSILDKRAGKIG